MVPAVAIPTPPTDSLYKFMAISGVLILISTQLFFWWAQHETEVKLIELELNAASLKIESEAMNRKVKSLEKQMEHLKKQPRQRAAEEMERRVEQQQELEDRHGVNIAETQAKIKHVKLLDTELRV